MIFIQYVMACRCQIITLHVGTPLMVPRQALLHKLRKSRQIRILPDPPRRQFRRNQAEEFCHVLTTSPFKPVDLEIFRDAVYFRALSVLASCYQSNLYQVSDFSDD